MLTPDISLRSWCICVQKIAYLIAAKYWQECQTVTGNWEIKEVVIVGREFDDAMILILFTSIGPTLLNEAIANTI